MHYPLCFNDNFLFLKIRAEQMTTYAPFQRPCPRLGIQLCEE